MSFFPIVRVMTDFLLEDRLTGRKHELMKSENPQKRITEDLGGTF